MTREKYLDDLIRREKQTEPNPFISTRVMAQIEKLQDPVIESKKVPVWQAVAFAASLSAVVFSGISIGKSYVNNASPESFVNINDSQIENLAYYNFDDNEQDK